MSSDQGEQVFAVITRVTERGFAFGQVTGGSFEGTEVFIHVAQSVQSGDQLTAQ